MWDRVSGMNTQFMYFTFAGTIAQNPSLLHRLRNKTVHMHALDSYTEQNECKTFCAITTDDFYLPTLLSPCSFLLRYYPNPGSPAGTFIHLIFHTRNILLHSAFSPSYDKSHLIFFSFPFLCFHRFKG